MADAPAPTIRAALDELVHQFADPYAFLRELVQNSIDAGSSEIEVDVTYDAARGVATVHVDDWGEGMTRHIIEKQLTRLFSSSKDGDHTKIGKFGIGFVSVFALDPELVCIDTARDGERWRVLFHRDRSFELIALDTPVEGTRIAVIKRATADEFAEIAERSERSLRFWCRHVPIELRFRGTPIREPFALGDAPVQVEERSELGHVVVGHREDGTPSCGFYNNGLTLFEGQRYFGGAAELEPVAFKVSSPQLEHTLTRDAVIEDAGFDRAIGRVRALVDGPLVAAVFERFDREHARADEELAYLLRIAAWHADRGGLPRSVDASRIATAPSGRSWSVAELRTAAARGLVAFAEQRAAVTDELERLGYPVLAGRPDDARAVLVRALLGDTVELVEVSARWCMPIVDVGERRPGWASLRDALAGLLATAGARLADIVLADCSYPGSPIADRIAITQADPGMLTALDTLDTLKVGLLSRRHTLVVNRDHALTREALALAEHEPEIAAYLLVKAFRLGRGLDAALDTRWIEHVVEQRWPTSTR